LPLLLTLVRPLLLIVPGVLLCHLSSQLPRVGIPPSTSISHGAISLSTFPRRRHAPLISNSVTWHLGRAAPNSWGEQGSDEAGTPTQDRVALRKGSGSPPSPQSLFLARILLVPFLKSFLLLLLSPPPSEIQGRAPIVGFSKGSEPWSKSGRFDQVPAESGGAKVGGTWKKQKGRGKEGCLPCFP